MIKRWLCAIALLIAVSGCSLTEPTVMDVSATKVEQLSARYELTEDELFIQKQPEIQAELTQHLGVQVDYVWKADDGKVFAQIAPATEEAFATALTKAGTDLGNLGSLMNGLLAGLGVLAAGLFGLRGEKKRKEEVNGNG